jgi:hypothetical protein
LLRYGSVGRQVRSVARGHKPLAAAAHHPSPASQPEFVFDKLAMSAFGGPFAVRFARPRDHDSRDRRHRAGESRWRSASRRRYDMPRISGSTCSCRRRLRCRPRRRTALPRSGLLLGDALITTEATFCAERPEVKNRFEIPQLSRAFIGLRVVSNRRIYALFVTGRVASHDVGRVLSACLRSLRWRRPRDRRALFRYCVRRLRMWREPPAGRPC